MILFLLAYLVVAGVLLAALEHEWRRLHRAAAHDRFVQQLEAWVGTHGLQLTEWQRQVLKVGFTADEFSRHLRRRFR